MNNLEAIRKEIKRLHDASKEEYIREWFFEGHVCIVASYAREIAEQEGADAEACELAALFHDVARCWGVEKDPELMEESLKRAEGIMKKHGYAKKKIQMVREAILNHSCNDELPVTDEGKVLATADAMAHLMTDFYFILPFHGWLKAADSYEGYKKWVAGKIGRDFNKKIFYRKQKALAKKRYEAFKTLFS